MTLITEKEKYCLFVINRGAAYKAVNDHIKTLNGFYNGAGWFVEYKNKEAVSQICQNANVFCIDFPLNNESFEDLKKHHKLDFFNEKRVKLKFKIDELKNVLGITEISTQEALESEFRLNLEKIDDGKKLLGHLEEYNLVIEQIKRCEEEDRLSKISLNQSFNILPYTLEDLQRELSQTKEGLKTGYAELDEMIRIPNEAITLIGGRPSHGKTTFMLNLFLNLIEQYPELNFYFFSYEETLQQIATKIINILSGWLFEESKNLIHLENYLKNGKTSFGMVENGKKKYQEFVDSGRLRIDSYPHFIHELPTIIALLKSKVPLGAVFIDYIQKIKNKQKFGTRQLELANTSNIILETAKSYSIPIILGAQLGRDKDTRDKVKLDNLREAGDLEQDAHLVLGIFNPSMEKAQDEQKHLTDRIIDLNITPLKNRNGIVNKSIILQFDRPLLQIKDKHNRKIHLK